jgi:hypothetical protein
MLVAWAIAGLGALALALGARPQGQRGPSAPLVAWLALALATLAIMGLQGWVLHGGSRWWPWSEGLCLGALVGAWGALGPSLLQSEQAPKQAAQLSGWGLLALGATQWWHQGDGVSSANAAIGLVLAWALAELLGWGARPARPHGGGLALALVAALGAAMTWWPTESPSAAAGLAWWPALACLVPAAWAWGGQGRWVPLGAGLALAVGVQLALAVSGWWGPTAWALGALALAVGLLASTAPEGDWRGPGAWLGVALAGLAWVLVGRVGGMGAMACAPLLLLVGAAGGRGQLTWWAALGAIFAGRGWLQLYLSRMDLTGYGLDLTHPYAHAALWVGALLVGLAAALRPGLRPAQGATLGLGLVAFPVLLGHAWHPEALGTLLVGLGLATAWAAGQGGVSETEAQQLPALAPPLVLGAVTVSLLAAPWLVSAMQAPRLERAAVLGLGLALALAWLGWRAKAPADA